MVAVARREHPGLRFEEGSMLALDLPDASLGVRALDRLTAKNAEPLDLWADAGADQEWLAGIAALRAVPAAA